MTLRFSEAVLLIPLFIAAFKVVLVVAAIIGIIAKVVISRWMARHDVELSEVQAQAGPRRGKRRVFLLGFWREEGPD